MAKAERRYWDSCAFLGWLLKEDDKKVGCGRVLDAAEDGRVVIITSTLTIAEVIHTKGKPAIPPDQEVFVETFFQRQFIVVRGLDRATAEFARRLVWAYKIRPKDAIHVATALTSPGVERLDTTDKTLLKKSGLKAEGRGPLEIALPDWDHVPNLFEPD